MRDDEALFFDSGYSFAVTIDSSQIVKVTAPTVYSSFFGLTYQTPNQNDVSTYQNQLLVFAGGPLLPIGAVPAGSGPASSGGGGYVFPAQGTSFSSQPYVCAYSVGPFAVSDGTGRYPNVAATAYLPGGVGGTEPIQTTASALGIQTAQTAFITWTYQLPNGVDPSKNFAWIGLWYGTVNPYTAAPNFFAPVYGSASKGESPMPGLRLSGSANYTGALFTSGYSAQAAHLRQTAVAAVIFFTLGPPQPP